MSIWYGFHSCVGDYGKLTDIPGTDDRREAMDWLLNQLDSGNYEAQIAIIEAETGELWETITEEDV